MLMQVEGNTTHDSGRTHRANSDPPSIIPGMPGSHVPLRKQESEPTRERAAEIGPPPTPQALDLPAITKSVDYFSQALRDRSVLS